MNSFICYAIRSHLGLSVKSERKIMRKIAIFLLILLTVSCGNIDDIGDKNRQLMASGTVPGFFATKSSNNKKDTSQPTDCREHIETVVCLVDPLDPSSIPSDDERPCLLGSEQYAEPFQKLYDNYPNALQQMFCSLDSFC